ncbi:MAG: hypothetical protein U0807_05255 [Candidatus Binatia bacterium]
MVRLSIALLVLGLQATPARAGDEIQQLRHELETMQRQLRRMQAQIEQQQAVIDHLTREHPTSAAPPAPAPTPTWSPTQPMALLRSGRNYLNLSLDLLTDAGWSTRADVPSLEIGDHDPNQRGFTLPNAEIAFDGAVDPYFKGFANVVFKLDEHNETQVELEEA